MRLTRHARRGAHSWLVALMLPVIIGFAALAVDTVYVQTGRIQAQATADAVAHAAYVKFRVQRGLGELADAKHAAEVAGRYVANQNEVLADAPDTLKLEFGDWDGSAFSPREALDADAVRVTLDRAGNAPSFLFGTLLGFHKFSTPATATVSGRPRAIVIAQDVTGSFIPALQFAEDANLAMLDFLIADALPDDRIGMVLWQRATPATPYTPMSSVRSAGSSIRSDWADLVPSFNKPWFTEFQKAWCAYMSMPVGSACNATIGTNQSIGLNKAVDMLLAETDPDAFRAIVIVSDGMPNYASDRDETAVAAARAWDAGIHVWAVAYEGTEGIDADFMEGMTSGRGVVYITPDAAELPAIMVQIAAEIPVVLTE